jgi:hypothetical protein
MHFVAGGLVEYWTHAHFNAAVPQSASHAERGTPAVVMLEGLQWLSRQTYSGSAVLASTA